MKYQCKTCGDILIPGERTKFSILCKDGIQCPACGTPMEKISDETPEETPGNKKYVYFYRAKVKGNGVQVFSRAGLFIRETKIITNEEFLSLISDIGDAIQHDIPNFHFKYEDVFIEALSFLHEVEE